MDEAAQEVDDMNVYLSLTCLALVHKLGGHVKLTPEEIAAAAALDAKWERDGRDYVITAKEDEPCPR